MLMLTFLISYVPYIINLIDLTYISTCGIKNFKLEAFLNDLGLLV